MSESYGLSYSGGIARRWGHYAPQLLSAAILAAIALGIRPVTPTPLILLAVLSLLAFVLATWLLMREHDRRLCESCAASMPLNAAEYASRYQRRFWLAHSGSNPRVIVPYLIVLIGSNFLTSTPGRLCWAIIQSSMVYLILAYSSHRMLQPWCPWCAGGGGGGGSDDFTPDPDLPRGNHRQLV
ncbi:MAG: hypothetical protein ABI140_13225 [Jatrophihabitantaceae bacterium]